MGTIETHYRVDEILSGLIIREALDSLSQAHQQVLMLAEAGLTQSQIAQQVGISQMHVSRLLRRALTTMRGRIEELMDDADG